MRKALLTLTAVLIAGAALSAEVKFTQPPTATQANAKVVIAFAVSVKTDVEVAILDAKGKVVRHLAAGVLGGEKAPPQPLKKGFAQAVAWDLRDDFGKPASGGPFKVRVRAGMKVAFGRTLGDTPYMISAISGMATDKEGNLYVFQRNFGYGSFYIQIFDSKGNYLRTMMPFAANLPPDKVSAYSYYDEAGKRFIMKNYSDVYPVSLPLSFRSSSLQLASTHVANGLFLTNGTSIFRVAKDGTPWKGKLDAGRLVGKDRGWNGKKALKRNQSVKGGKTKMGICPEGKFVYATLAYSKIGKDGKLANAHWKPGCIYRTEIGSGKSVEPWKTLNTGPLELLTVGPKGNLFALAISKGQVVVISPEGKVIGKLPVKTSARIDVHPKTGEVYVFVSKKLAYQRYQKTLTKFSGFKNARTVATLDFGVKRGGGGNLVVSFDGKTTGVWIGQVESGGGRVGRSDVTLYVDMGKEFVPTLKLHDKDPDALGNHDTIAVDRFTEDVYINDDYSGMYRYNGLTGKGGNLNKVAKNFKATDLCVGHDGNLYARTDRGKRYSGPLERLDRNLKPVPFGGSGTHLLSPYIYSRYGAGFGEKGIATSRDGNCFVTFMYGWTKYCTAGFGPDGKALKGNFLEGQVGKSGKAGSYPKELTSAILGPVPRTNGGLRIDSKGNIYIGVGQLPKGYKFAARYAKDKGYKALLGSVIKFGPKGGGWIRTNTKTNAIKEPVGTIPEGAKGLAMEAGHFILGAKQAYIGIGPFSGTYGTGRSSTGKRWCDCRSARFDIDMHDRLYLPNAVENLVRIYDNAGNKILDFGGYANYDSQYVPEGAKQPLVKTDYIPLGWPIGTGVSDEYIYISDQLNRSVVRVDKSYAATATCTIGGGPAKVTRAKTSAATASTTVLASSSNPSDKSDQSDKPDASIISKTPLRTPQSEVRSPKKVCTGWLAMARNYKSAGLTTSARKYLQKVIRAYPDTKWATRARAELTQL
jgi:hypothetical protein